MSCSSPLTIFPKYFDKNGNSEYHRSYGVPCGKCAPCKTSRVSGWRIRLMEEEKVSKNAYFITLTYDTQHVPIVSTGYMSLKREHLKKFFKNLKRRQDRQKSKPKDYPNIKYYACGEYGTIKKRPHYHAIIFNLYDPIDIPKTWKYGKIDVQVPRSEAPLAYTANYMSKEGTPKWKAQLKGIEPQFSNMSMKLGVSYALDKQNVRYHQADLLNRVFITQKGIKYPMPTYYKKIIYKKWQRDKIARHAQMLATEKPEYNDTDLEMSIKVGIASKFNHFKRNRE